jgi:hypothetical protein
MKALYTLGGTVPAIRVVREYRAALLPLALVLAINLVALVALVLPLTRSVSSNEARAQAAEKQQAVAEAEFKRAEALREANARATEDLETFYQQVLPGNVAAARRVLQLKLRQQAQEHGVSYQGGDTNEEEIRDSNLLRLTMSMRLTGAYDDIRGFIYELETAPDFVIIENLRLAEGDLNQPLGVALEVSTYYRTPQPAALRTSSNGR